MGKGVNVEEELEARPKMQKIAIFVKERTSKGDRGAT